MEIIERRDNGSFVIRLPNGAPYHVIPGEPLWEEVCEQEGVDPKEQAAVYQAEVYAVNLMPPQLAEKEVHMSAGIE